MKSLPPTLATLAIVLLLIGSYVGGYFLLGKRFELIEDTPVIGRTFEEEWIRDLYHPMAWIEAKATGARVYLVWSDDPDPFLPDPFLP